MPSWAVRAIAVTAVADIVVVDFAAVIAVAAAKAVVDLLGVALHSNVDMIVAVAVADIEVVDFAAVIVVAAAKAVVDMLEVAGGGNVDMIVAVDKALLDGRPAARMNSRVPQIEDLEPLTERAYYLTQIGLVE